MICQKCSAVVRGQEVSVATYNGRGSPKVVVTLDGTCKCGKVTQKHYKVSKANYDKGHPAPKKK